MKVLITGGAGYVGLPLTYSLLKLNYQVTVLDLFWFIEQGSLPAHPQLKLIQGDIRNTELLQKIIPGHDTIIHLACLSNDPSYDIDQEFSRSINYDCFENILLNAKRHGIKRFIYASSSSVYGVSVEPRVHEEIPLKPLTPYSRDKALCEELLWRHQSQDFCVTAVRPATVCGPSLRMRLDLIVNIMASQGFYKRKLTVFGGDQYRPNIHIEDMIAFYQLLLNTDKSKINGRVFNCGSQNKTVLEIAQLVCKNINKEIELEITQTHDPRSYRIDSTLALHQLGFKCNKTIEDAIIDMNLFFEKGSLQNPITSPLYHNIKKIKELLQTEQIH